MKKIIILIFFLPLVVLAQESLSDCQIISISRTRNRLDYNWSQD
ncbi:MAG: hypothetical protein P9L89_02665 [Candidatus Celaenobacter polaris]|nr:hypothetical protein [Candidatus Celaenobacter polaris]